MNDDDDSRLQHYIDIGAVELAGVDESGELIFAIHETAKELAPELWAAHMDHIDKTLVDLYQAGYLRVEYDENLEAEIMLSPEGLAIAKAKGIIPMDMPEIPND